MYGKGKKCADVFDYDYDAQSAKIDKERKLLNIKQIKEGIKKEKARGFGSHLSASNIIGGLNCNKNNINNNLNNIDNIIEEKEIKVAKPFT